MTELIPLRHIVELQRAEADAYRRAWRLIDVFEWLVKWESAVVIGDLLDRAAPTEALRRLLARSLTRPSLGHWMHYLRLALEATQDDRPYRRWDRLLELERRHRLIAFRNSYAHGAVESDAQARATCERFEPVMDDLLDSPFAREVGLVVVAEGTTIHLGGPTAPPTWQDNGPPAPGAYAWIDPLGLAVWLWPLASFLTEPTSGVSGLYFHNAVRHRRIEALNYDLPHQARRRDLLERFHGRVPLDRWRAETAPELDPNRIRIRQLTDGLVGRDEEVDELVRHLASGAIEAVVLGVPGQGKSAVMAAVVERLRDEELAVIDTFLRRGDAHSSPVAVLRSWVLRLSNLMGLVTEAASSLMDLGEQVTALLTRWSQNSPRDLLVLVDGLDERPDLLPWLPTPGGNVHVIWSGRPTGEVKAAIVDRSVRRADRWQLKPLDAEAVRAVLYRSIDKLDERLTDGFVAAVRQRSGGNPLFLIALSDLLYEQPELIGRADLLPSEVTELFEASVARASGDGEDEHCLRILHLLAVSERHLAPREIAGLIDSNRVRVQQALGALGELLTSDEGTAEPAYGLYHEAVRDWLAVTDPEALLEQHERLARRSIDPDRSSRSYLVRFGIVHLAVLADADPRAASPIILGMMAVLSRPLELRSRAAQVGSVELTEDVAQLYVLAVEYDLPDTDRLPDALVRAVREGSGSESTSRTPSRERAKLSVGTLHDALIYRADQRFTTAVYERIDVQARGHDPDDLELRVLLAGWRRRRGTDADRQRARELLDPFTSDRSHIDARILARATYEQAYLANLEDRPQEAIAGMEASAELALRAGDQTGSWIARCVALHFRYHAGSLEPVDYARYLDQAAVHFRSAETSDTAASRWVTNVAAQAFDLALDVGDLPTARQHLAALEVHPWIVSSDRQNQLQQRRRRLLVLTGAAHEVVEQLQAELERQRAARPVRDGRAREYLDLAEALMEIGATEQAQEVAREGLASPIGCATWKWRPQLERLQ